MQPRIKTRKCSQKIGQNFGIGLTIFLGLSSTEFLVMGNAILATYSMQWHLNELSCHLYGIMMQYQLMQVSSELPLKKD